MKEADPKGYNPMTVDGLALTSWKKLGTKG